MSNEAPARPETSGGSRYGSWQAFATPAAAVALAWTAFQISLVIWPLIDVPIQRSGHVAFAVALALLITAPRLPQGRLWRGINAAFAFSAFLPFVWIILHAQRIEDRYSGLDPLLWGDYAGAILLLVLLTEASRRIMGLGITLLAVGFVAYQLLGQYLPGVLSHRAHNPTDFLDNQFLTVQGIFGVPTGVAVDIVFYFILFAAVYEVFGGGKMIIDLALSVTGTRTGGPAKAAIVSSGLMGSVSGSAVANVMSTGIFTIPLMMRIRYDPRFAGAVEAVASTGGQIMPPVMGAAAFVMADYLQMPYRDIVLAALLPALLYYLALGFAVDLEARKRNLAVLSRAEMPDVRQVLRDSGHMLIPLAWLAYRIVSGYSITSSSIEAVVLTIACGLLRRTTRQGPLAVVRSFALTAERCLNVTLPCATASVIVSVIAFTGLGTKFTGLVVLLSGGSLEITLVLAMVASLILGAGMPTTSAYIMGAVLVAPALVTLGLSPLSAHLFVFYFAIMSMLTPPVALAAYAAATISGSSSSATGWKAVSLAMPGFLIPFGFLLHPGLLLDGGAIEAIWGAFSLLLAFFAVSVAIVGWMFRQLAAWERAFFGVVGLVSIHPHPATTVLVLVVLGLAVWRCRSLRNSDRAA